MDFLNCYICNSETKLRSSVRIRTKTKYSGIGVHEVIQSFVKESHLLRFSPNDIVCERCFQKVNQYDLACRMADEIQQDITSALYATEQEYLSEEPIEFLEDVQSDKNACQKDFEEFQEMYDLERGSEQVEIEDIPISNITEQLNDDIKSGFNDQDDEIMKANRKLLTACTNCNIAFGTKKELKQHQLRYHIPKKCGVCQKLFTNQMELRTHTRNDHEIEHGSNDETEITRGETQSNETDGTFRCEVCGASESTQKSLDEHIALHENQLKCVVCSTILKHKANLVLHMRIHADKKFFKCDKCEKTFVHKSSLRMHLQTTHTDVRNKECPECPLKFKTTSQLNQHLVTHSGIKKHSCPKCGKAFGQKYNMTAHYKSHFLNKMQRRAQKRDIETASSKIEL